MSTVAQMVTHVQSFAPSLSLTRDNILVDLNNALQDLMEEADLEATTGVGGVTAMLTVANQQTYALPSNCVKPRALQWRLSSVLAQPRYLDLDDYRRVSQTGTGTDPALGNLYWTLWGGLIWLWPIPSAAGTAGGDGELVLDYYKKPAALVNDGDTPDIPDQYHNLLEFYATSFAYAKADEGQWSAHWMGLFREGKGQMQMERATLQRAMPPRVRPARW